MPSTVTAFPLRLRPHYKSARVGGVNCTERMNKLSIILMVLFCASCTEKGFYSETISEPSSSSFESIAHYKYCFHNERKLSKCGFISVSPDSKHALIQESESGNLYVYNSQLNTKVWLTNDFIGLVDSVSWQEDKKSIVVKTNKVVKVFTKW